jgi:hypothetical protein
MKKQSSQFTKFQTLSCQLSEKAMKAIKGGDSKDRVEIIRNIHG